MNILFNASPAVRPVTGIRTYAMELLRHLLEADKTNRYTIFSIRSPFPNQRIRFLYPEAANASYRSFIFPYRYMNIIWNNLKLLPIENIIGDDIDILHSLDKTAPFTRKARVLVTIHDMSWYISRPEVTERSLLYKQIVETLKRAAAIITVSEFSRGELVRYMPFTRDKIHVIRHGVSDRFHPLERQLMPQEIDKKYPWGDYILYIGMLGEPRKNLEMLIRAYAILRRERRVKEKLVLAGTAGPGSRPVFNLIKKMNLSDDVLIHSKWIPDEDVPYIYNKARLAVFPSLYEGFGLFVLESMACGRPVILSNIPALREVASDAAIFVDPRNPDEIAAAIERILCDEKLYKEMVEKGLKRSAEFTWKKTATQTLELYERCAEGPR